MLPCIEKEFGDLSCPKILFKHIITPDILKHPTVVILLMFFESVMAVVMVGSKPISKITTAGKTVKETTRSPAKISIFCTKFSLRPLFLFDRSGFGLFKGLLISLSNILG